MDVVGSCEHINELKDREFDQLLNNSTQLLHTHISYNLFV